MTNSSLKEYAIKMGARANYQLLHAKDIQGFLRSVSPQTAKVSNRQSKKELKFTVEATIGQTGETICTKK